MIGPKLQDECFILVKALPHRSSKYFETVCCAGIGRDGKWRRQYPVPFRILDAKQKFGRWNWISYEFVRSKDDRRLESQKVIPESLTIQASVKPNERARFLNPLIRSSFREADSRSESLTMLRPRALEILHYEKSAQALQTEKEKHAALANQMSIFDKSAKPLEPCPMRFVARWQDADGATRRHSCDDWETSYTYKKFERSYGSEKAIAYIKDTYERAYMKAGLVLVFSTHSRRNVTNNTPNQWLLVGLVRLDFDDQKDMFIS